MKNMRKRFVAGAVLAGIAGAGLSGVALAADGGQDGGTVKSVEKSGKSDDGDRNMGEKIRDAQDGTNPFSKDGTHEVNGVTISDRAGSNIAVPGSDVSKADYAREGSTVKGSVIIKYDVGGGVSVPLAAHLSVGDDGAKAAAEGLKKIKADEYLKDQDFVSQGFVDLQGVGITGSPESYFLTGDHSLQPKLTEFVDYMKDQGKDFDSASKGAVAKADAAKKEFVALAGGADVLRGESALPQTFIGVKFNGDKKGPEITVVEAGQSVPESLAKSDGPKPLVNDHVSAVTTITSAKANESLWKQYTNQVKGNATGVVGILQGVGDKVSDVKSSTLDWLSDTLGDKLMQGGSAIKGDGDYEKLKAGEDADKGVKSVDTKEEKSGVVKKDSTDQTTFVLGSGYLSQLKATGVN